MTPLNAVNVAERHETATDVSVVFAPQGGLANNQKTIESLLVQTIAPRIEVIVISEKAELLRDIEEFILECGSFSRCEFLLQPGNTAASGRRNAALKATAPVVAFVEDHSFPEPNWAEEIRAAFASSPHILAAAPLLLNPNPDSAVSRAQFLLNHGFRERGIEAERFEDIRYLPWHGTAYRTDIFRTETRDSGVALLQAEVFLQDAIRHAHPGARFVRCGRTRSHHVNMSRLYPAMLLAFWGGRIFGAVRTRQQGWGFFVRFARSLLFPVIAVLKLFRTASLLRDRSSWLRTFTNFSTAVLLAFAHAIGEAIGTCFGLGHSERAYAALEFNRANLLRPGERHILFSNAPSPQDA